ncbi:MFS transporter [Chloroflexota bacterium]
MVSISDEVKKPKKIFYGWWIVLAGMTNNFLSGSMFVYGFSAFFLPISQELGWKRAVMSAPIAISRLEGALLGPVEGYLVDKFGPRKLMFIGVLLVGTGFALISRIHSLAMFYLIFFLFKGLGAGLITVSIQVAIANWFRKRRGLGLGIALGGHNVGAMAVPAIVWLIATRGWRGAALIIGIIMWVVQLPLSLIMRHRPEPYGYLPDGVSEQQAKEAEAPGRKDSTLVEQNFTPMQAVRTRAFWFINIAYGSRMMITAAIPLHLIAFIQDLGHSAATGGSIMAIMGAFALIGRVGMGYLADILPKRFAFATCMTALAISMFMLANAQSVWQLVLWALIYGPGYGGGSPVMGAMVADYYGRKFFGTINGLTHIVMAVTTVVGPVFAGYMFDITGSYRLAFISFVAIGVVGAISAILATRPPQSMLAETLT